MRKNVVFILTFVAIQAAAWCISLLFKQSLVAFSIITMYSTHLYFGMWMIYELNNIRNNKSVTTPFTYDVFYEVKEDIYKFKC